MRGERNIFDQFAVLFSVAIVWIYALLLTVGGAYKHRPETTQTSCRTGRAGIFSGAPWISVPYPFQWEAPTFAAGEAFAMMMASFVALVESTGSFIAISRYTSVTPVPPSVHSCGIGWQGGGILLSGIFGTGNGSSVSVENAGLLALTRVGSRHVVQIATGFIIFFSILAGLLAFVLDITLREKDSASRKDRGMIWWDRFRSFKSDTRSEEFYSLPFNLNKFFPSV